MNNCTNNNCHGSEIRTILERINSLQKKAVKEEVRETCDLNSLRCEEPRFEINTRPITLYGCCDRQLLFPTEREDSGCIGEENLSCVFRVEDVKCDVVTCRVLIPVEEAIEEVCNSVRFLSTNSFFTLKIADISAIRCLSDTFVDLCIR